MALKFISKKNPNKVKKVAVIVLLGTINKGKANYSTEKNIKNLSKLGEYTNMFPLIVDNFYKEENTQIIPIYTKESLVSQKEVIKDKNFDIETNGICIDENNFDDIFNSINEILSDEKYTEFIIDISHGFRHLPILVTVSMIINNFQDSSKIKQILFAKEEERFSRYKIIDLKDYLEIANISFVLNTFNDNYTVAHHINSKKYKNLIKALNDFSNDIMALSLNNLVKSSLSNLTKELDAVEDISIKTLAKGLKKNLEKDFSYESKRFLTYYKFSKNLVEKNYILLSLSLLYESIRMFIKTSIKQDEPLIVKKIENYFDRNLYKLGDFFKNLEWKEYDELKEIKYKITKEEYQKLCISYKKRMPNNNLIKSLSNTRNNLSHANSEGNFKTIKAETKKLIEHYNKTYSLDSILQT